jgi:hypothetical protein
MYISRFGTMAGWAHTILFSAQIKQFRVKAAKSTASREICDDDDNVRVKKNTKRRR